MGVLSWSSFMAPLSFSQPIRTCAARARRSPVWYFGVPKSTGRWRVMLLWSRVAWLTRRSGGVEEVHAMGQAEAAPVTGRTRWRRFLAVMAPAYVAVAGI